VRIGRGRSGTDATAARIIVGVDASTDAQRAVHLVAERTWPAGTAIRLITVVDSRIETAMASPEPVAQWLDQDDESDAAWIRRMHEASAERLRPTPVSVSPMTLTGDPKRVLVEEAERWGADAIVVGARSLSTGERFLLGSVSAAVASRAHCSVEVVRAKRTRD
jgi:nucleotide-binding universal stress UspA family protein